jgi:hypothetical protein
MVLRFCGERERVAGRGRGIAAPVDLEGGVVDCMELERLECGKAPPKYIGRPRRSVCFVFTLHEIWSQKK